jgi:hypothetical protein
MSDRDAFWRGVGSSLDLYGTSKDEPDFHYKGKDLGDPAQEGWERAFSSGWSLMGILMEDFIAHEICDE